MRKGNLNRSRKRRGGFSQRRAAQKEIFQPTRMGRIRRGLARSNVPQYLIGNKDRWRYITQTKRTPRSRKRQESPSPTRYDTPEIPKSTRHKQKWLKYYRKRVIESVVAMEASYYNVVVPASYGGLSKL